MSVDDLTFDLQHGLQDKEGNVHKTVVMARASFATDQLLSQDPRFRALKLSGTDLQTGNPIHHMAGLMEMGEVRMIEFRILVKSIGTLTKEQVTARLGDISRDDMKIIASHTRGGGNVRTIPYDAVIEAAQKGIESDQLRTGFLRALGEVLGEAQ